MDYRVSGTELTSIANAIRTKGGTSQPLTFPNEFVSAIQNIPTPTLQTKSKTYTPTETQQTDTIQPDSGYNGLDKANVTVNAIQTETKSVTPSTSSQDVTPSSGKYLKKVTVGAIQTETKTATPTESAQTITPSSGKYLTSVEVGAIDSDYIGSDIPRKSSADLTVSGKTVTAPSGFYSASASKSVADGTEGTPIATKGTVSNHSMSVTPSVTNSAGYIVGGTKTGTAVTVSASDLVSGSETKTENGTFDVTNLAELIVNVPLGLEYEEGTWQPTEDIARGWVPFSNTHTDPPVLVTLADVTGTPHSELNTNYNFVYFDYWGLWGEGIPYGTSDFRYASLFFNIRTTSTASVTTASRVCSYKSSSTESSSVGYPRYWADPTGFHPYSYSTSRYWRAGRIYKWIAIWK